MMPADMPMWYFLKEIRRFIQAGAYHMKLLPVHMSELHYRRIFEKTNGSSLAPVP